MRERLLLAPHQRRLLARTGLAIPRVPCRTIAHCSFHSVLSRITARAAPSVSTTSTARLLSLFFWSTHHAQQRASLTKQLALAWMDVWSLWLRIHTEIIPPKVLRLAARHFKRNHEDGVRAPVRALIVMRFVICFYKSRCHEEGARSL